MKLRPCAPADWERLCAIHDAALARYLREGFKVVRRRDGKLAGNEKFAASGYVLQYAANGA